MNGAVKIPQLRIEPIPGTYFTFGVWLLLLYCSCLLRLDCRQLAFSQILVMKWF